MEIVTTVKGLEVEKSKTRYINGEYFKIGDPSVEGSGDCYKIGDKYYRDGDYIIYDHHSMSYQVRNNFYIIGVIRVEGDKVIKGYFFHNTEELKPKIADRITGRLYLMINEGLLEGNPYFKEDLTTGIYVNHYSVPSVNLSLPLPINNDQKRELDYNCDKQLPISALYYDRTNIEIKDSSSRDISNILNGLSFGMEFESSKGYVPKRKALENGLIAVRDGSISGFEYVTIPLQGEKGVQALSNCLELLSERTEYDDSCSVHLHIGNIPRTEEFILAMYRTMHILQDEIFALFPLYKKYNFDHKRKNYTKPLPDDVHGTMDLFINDDNIKSNFDVMFRYLSMGSSYSKYRSDLSEVQNHPSDPDGTRKWQTSTRYHYYNTIPIIFGNKKTVEFRIHTPTYDKVKIMNYLVLTACIVNFVKDNTKYILEMDRNRYRSINLQNILSNMSAGSGSDKSKLLIREVQQYIMERKREVYQKNSNQDIFFKEDDLNRPMSGAIKVKASNRVVIRPI